MKFSCVTIFGSHVSNCFKTSSNKGVASAWSPAGVVSPAALVLRQKPVMTLSGRMGSVHTPWKWDWKSGKEPHRDPFENARMSVVTYISMRKNDVKWKIRLGLPITSFSPIYCNGWTTSWFAHGGVRWKFEQSKPFLLFSISAFLWELNGTKYLWWFTHQIDHVQSGYMGASMMQNPKHSIGESGPKKNCAWGFPKIGQNLQARSRDIWIAGHLPQPHQSHVQQLLCVTHGQAIETQTVEKSKAVLVKTSASSALNYPLVMSK